MDNPLVSIILRTCDRPKYLSMALRSIKEQSMLDIEVLLIDTGRYRCDAVIFKDFPRPLAYFQETEAGAAAALNIGLVNAKGKYVAFLDDDDIWDKNFLSLMCNVIKENSVDVVACNAYYIIGNKKIKKVIPKIPREKLLGMMIAEDFLITDAMLIRYKAIMDVGTFDETLLTNMDWDMWLRMLLNGKKFLLVTPCLTYVNIHASNISKNKITCAISQLAVLRKLEVSKGLLSSNERDLLDKAIARRKIFLGVSLIEDGKAEKGRREILYGITKSSFTRKAYGVSIFLLSFLFSGNGISSLLYFLNQITGRYKKRPHFYT